MFFGHVVCLWALCGLCVLCCKAHKNTRYCFVTMTSSCDSLLTTLQFHLFQLCQKFGQNLHNIKNTSPSTCLTGPVYYWSVFLHRDMEIVKKVKAETSSSFVSHFFWDIVYGGHTGNHKGWIVPEVLQFTKTALITHCYITFRTRKLFHKVSYCRALIHHLNMYLLP